MPSSHAIKVRTRELHVAHPELTYMQARRAVVDLRDPLSFRTFVRAAHVKGVADVVPTRVAADLALPGGRNIEAIAGFAHGHYASELAGAVDDALEQYRLWLRQFGAIGRIIAGEGRAIARKTAWQDVAFDQRFPTGSNADVLNAYLDKTQAANGTRAVVESVFDRYLRRDRFNDLENWYDIVAPYSGDFGGYGRARIWPMRELPQLIRTSKTLIRPGWVPEPAGIGPAIHFVEGGKPSPDAREAVMVTEAGGFSDLYVQDTGDGNRWASTGVRWENGDPADPRPTNTRERFEMARLAADEG